MNQFSPQTAVDSGRWTVDSGLPQPQSSQRDEIIQV